MTHSCTLACFLRCLLSGNILSVCVGTFLHVTALELFGLGIRIVNRILIIVKLHELDPLLLSCKCSWILLVGIYIYVNGRLGLIAWRALERFDLLTLRPRRLNLFKVSRERLFIDVGLGGKRNILTPFFVVHLITERDRLIRMLCWAKAHAIAVDRRLLHLLQLDLSRFVRAVGALSSLSICVG